MVRLRQHVPAFVETDVRQRAEAATLGELLETPWVKQYAQDTEAVESPGVVRRFIKGSWQSVQVIYPAPTTRRFHQWSRSDDVLMVEFDGGDWCWVVGAISSDDPREVAALPLWHETATATASREAWNRGDTGPAPQPYRCAEHGVDDATCCWRV